MGKRDWYIKLRKGGTKKNPSSGRVVGTRGPYKTKTNAVSAGNRLINGYELPTGVKLVVEQGDVGVPKAPAAKKTNPKRKHPRRKNTHLTVGANVKLSAKGIQQKHRYGTEQPPVMPSQMAPEDWRGVVAEVWDEGGEQGYTVEDRRGRRDYMPDHLLVAADSRTRKFPGTGYKGKTPRRSNPFSPYFKVGTTVSGTPVYTERLTVAELKKKSPKSKGQRHARDMSDVHRAAADQSADPLSSYHWHMTSAFADLASLHQYDEADAAYKKQYGVSPQVAHPKEDLWNRPRTQASLSKSLKYARMALDEHYAKHGDNQILRLHYTGEVTPERVIAAGKRWRRENPAKWVQGVDKEMEERGTVGAFTKQARRAGYSDTMEYARKVMAGWRSGKKTVLNKKTRRQQKITQKTMYRANFAINVQKRNPRKNTPILSQTPHPQRNNPMVGVFSPVNSAWVIIVSGPYGEDIIDIDGQRFFNSKSELAATLKQKGLKLGRGGKITSDGTKRNPYFPKPAYADKKRRQYKMNPRKNASPYRAFVKREMPRLRREGHSPTDAMKIIGTMWKRRMKR